MHILIDNKCGTPIYEQIFTQIKQQILSGDLKENDALPSIRGLARDLRISFITTKRAYEELEQAGFIYTLPAKGCYVSARSAQWLREDALRRIEEHIEQMLHLAASCRMTREELLEMIRINMEEQA